MFISILTCIVVAHHFSIQYCLLHVYSEPAFHVPTEAAEMTPERFHDFLSLASSPPLPSSFPPRPLPSTPPSQHSLTEQEGLTGSDKSSGEQRTENDSIPSAPSFAQVNLLLYDEYIVHVHTYAWLEITFS